MESSIQQRQDEKSYKREQNHLKTMRSNISNIYHVCMHIRTNAYSLACTYALTQAILHAYMHICTHALSQYAVS